MSSDEGDRHCDGTPTRAHFEAWNDSIYPNALPVNEAFGQMRKRHMLMKEQYPDKPADHGPAFTGLSNARPETEALGDPSHRLEGLPYDVKKLIEMELPWAFEREPDIGQ